MAARSQTTIRLVWLITVVCILLLSLFGRQLQSVLYTVVQPELLAGLIIGVLALVVLLLFFKRERLHVSLVNIVMVSVLLIGAVVAVVAQYLNPIEACHFLVFSWFGWISAAAFGRGYGICTIISMAVGDELLQWYLPNRVGDVHDVVINLISGVAGLLLKGKWKG